MVVKHQNTLPREDVVTSSEETFEIKLDEALTNLL